MATLDGSVRKDLKPNKVREIRESKMMSKAELARKTGLSVQTIDRVEKGYYCRLDTKRKILIALGLDLDDRNGVFCED
jgi:DNA-binding XRE family transcriptional regulator